MTDEELMAIRERRQRATTLNNEAVIAGADELPFLRFCAANYLSDVIELLAEVERLREREALVKEIVLAVAQGRWGMENGVAGCAFCGAPFHYPTESVDHKTWCVTILARALIAG